jgi:bifunctional non-homologous end joining protein LigD
VTLTSPERVLWPEAAFTKRDAADYYRAVWPVLEPHVVDRPLTVLRIPEGVDGPRWYMTRCRGGLRTRRVPGRSGTPQEYCLVDSLDDLLRLVNMGGVELHPLLSRGPDVDRATHLVFDLDPGPPADAVDCIPVALSIRDELPAAVVKTSGSLGLHVTVPLPEPLPFEDTKAAARALARRLAGPRVTDRPARAERAGKVFVDWNQNDRTKSIVAPYSLRALPFPTVSTPLSWEELETATHARDLVFLARDVLARLSARGSPQPSAPRASRRTA